MNIRFAEEKDIPDIIELLKQVAMVHHIGRPDLFKSDVKYSSEQIKQLIKDESRPILVADENGNVVGHACCIIKEYKNGNTDIKTLHIDDLCVDEKRRRQHIGTALYEAALKLARERGCHNLTLNVWQLNKSAMDFYIACGLKPLNTCMEQIIE